MLDADDLVDAITALLPTTSHVEAAGAFVSAYHEYAKEGVAQAVALPASVPSVDATLENLSVPAAEAAWAVATLTPTVDPETGLNQLSTLMEAVLLAYWGALVAAPAAAFLTATALTPPVGVSAAVSPAMRPHVFASTNGLETLAGVLDAVTRTVTVTFPGAPPIVATLG